MLKTTPRPAPRPSAAVTQTLALLALSPQELLWRLSVEAAENPALHLRRPPPDPGRMQIRDAEGVAAGADGLIAHVLRQIDLMDFAAGDRAIAIVLTEALEPTGWLGTAPARIARACGQPEARVLAVLDRLQWIEPGGLFARSLAECLRLQARQAGELGPQMEAVLADLPLLAAAGPAALAETTGLSQADVSAMFGLIRGYDPKPGLAFGNAGPVAPPADLLIAQEGQRWVARPNPLAVDLRVEAGHPGSRTAEALRQAVEGRLRIALAVGSVLAGRQSGWLAGGRCCP